MGHTCHFAFFGTHAFHNNYNASAKLDQERDWFKQYAWSDIANEGAFYTYPNKIVNAGGKKYLDDRLRIGDNWLENNFSTYCTYSDCCIILDHWGNDPGRVGYAYINNVADCFNQSVIVDYDSNALYSFDDLNVPQRRYLGQEVGHMFDAYHRNSGIGEYNKVDFMWESEADSVCFDNGSKEHTLRDYRPCAEQRILYACSDC